MSSQDKHNPQFASPKKQEQVRPDASLQSREDIAVLICIECGEENELDASWCEECGAKIGVNELVCNHCGEKNEAEAAFCEDCGTPMADVPQTEPEEPQTRTPSTPPQPVIKNKGVLDDIFQNPTKALKPKPKPELATPEHLQGVEDYREAKYKDRVGEVDEILAKFETVKRSWAELASNRDHKLENPPPPTLRLWQCNFTNTYHQRPGNCGKPNLGGTWYDVSPDDYRKLLGT